jgi:DNA-binding MarR family transcriptional regulator
MTHAQASCLMMLAKGEATTVTDLARNLNTDAGSVTRLLSRMEKRGLIERTRRDDDRRVVDLSLTAEGEAMVEKLPVVFCNDAPTLRGVQPGRNRDPARHVAKADRQQRRHCVGGQLPLDRNTG